jgi:hypothetical protein
MPTSRFTTRLERQLRYPPNDHGNRYPRIYYGDCRQSQRILPPIGRLRVGKFISSSKIDWQVTYLDAMTSAAPAAARFALVCANDREALNSSLTAAGVWVAALVTMRDAERYFVAGDSAALACGPGDDFAGFPPVA